MSDMHRKRIEYLDIGKGICIILMVLCHAYANCNSYIDESGGVFYNIFIA